MNVNVFGPDSYKDYANKIIARKINKKDVDVRHVKNGLICSHQKHSVMGVYDAENNFVSQSNLIIGTGAHKSKIKAGRNVEYNECDVLFLGDLHWHFGHFLLEHTNRMWAIEHFKDKVHKFVFVYSALLKELPGWFYDFMEMSGVDKDRVLILDRDVRFRTVIVPDCACNNNSASNQWVQTFQNMAKNTKDFDCCEKVYLSRSALDKRRTFGELQIQRIFERNGFCIICPEKYTLLQQVGMIKNARILAGCAGTALHLALFMKPGGRLIQIKRNSVTVDNLESQYLINSLCELDTDVVCASVEREPTEHFSSAPQIIGVNDYMAEFFKQNKFQYSKLDLKPKYVEEQEYLAQLQQYKTKWGSVRANKIRNRLIKYSSCLIPSRKLRSKYRNYMKAKFVAR